MTNERKCLACGRPLTGRQRKWCSRSDCGGWEAVHPPTTLKCVSCGSTFETYVGSGYTECKSCRYTSPLRNPGAIAESDMERLVADYVRKDEAIKYLRWAKSIGPNVTHYEDGGTTVRLGPIDIAVRTTIESSSYNPNFCENCGKVVNHGQYGNCGVYQNEGCGKKNPNAITTSYCSNCGDYTLFDGKGFCLKCNQINEHHTAGDSAAEVWARREIRYKKYTGIKLERFKPDNRTLGEKYWSFIFEQAPKIMYNFVCDGWTPDEIGEEFERSRSQVVQMVRQYAKENNLENPYPRSVSTRRKRKV